MGLDYYDLRVLENIDNNLANITHGVKNCFFSLFLAGLYVDNRKTIGDVNAMTCAMTCAIISKHLTTNKIIKETNACIVPIGMHIILKNGHFVWTALKLFAYKCKSFIKSKPAKPVLARVTEYESIKQSIHLLERKVDRLVIESQAVMLKPTCEYSLVQADLTLPESYTDSELDLCSHGKSD